ncbi:hypothetical protein [Streptomyces sp. NPDC020681]|uniref:hypothetical protein n=1 Tax=Streptomyces sp. NPDC020681 TaxID=3365083 RepID=UPI0037B04E87
MQLRPKERKSARHRSAGMVGLHMDGSMAAGLVYETLSAIFRPAPPGAGAIGSDGGPTVSTRSFDVRRQHPLSELVRLRDEVPALVHGRPADVKRLVAGLRSYFTVVEETGARDVGHRQEERGLRIGPKE